MDEMPFSRTTMIIISVIVFASLVFYYSFSTDNPRYKVFTTHVNSVKAVEVTHDDMQRHGKSVPNVLREKMFKNEDLDQFPLVRKKKQPLGVQPDSYKNTAWQSDVQRPTARGSVHYKFGFTGRGPKAKIVCIPWTLRKEMAKSSKILPGPRSFGHKEKFPHMFSLTTRTSRWGPIIYKCYVTGDNPEINKIFY